MVLKVVLRLDPTKLKAAMAATAINAAITAYSIAVTPDSLLIKLEKNVSNLVIPFAYLEYIHNLQLKALRNIKKNPRLCLAAPRAERVLCNPTYPPLTPICKPRWSLPAGGPLERGPPVALARRGRKVDSNSWSRREGAIPASLLRFPGVRRRRSRGGRVAWTDRLSKPPIRWHAYLAVRVE